MLAIRARQPASAGDFVVPGLHLVDQQRPRGRAGPAGRARDDLEEDREDSPQGWPQHPTYG
jgi:hypothetical protein